MFFKIVEYLRLDHVQPEGGQVLIRRKLPNAQVVTCVIERGFFSEFGEAALFCVTEVHSKQDIDRLVYSIKEVLEA